ILATSFRIANRRSRSVAQKQEQCGSNAPIEREKTYNGSIGPQKFAAETEWMARRVPAIGSRPLRMRLSAQAAGGFELPAGTVARSGRNLRRPSFSSHQELSVPRGSNRGSDSHSA